MSSISTQCPEGLGNRGRSLWADLAGDGNLAADRLALLAEACRIADRLDLLDRLIDENREHYGEMLRFLAESRQQSATFRALLAEIRRDAPAAAAPGGGEVKGVSDLTARIAARRREAQG